MVKEVLKRAYDEAIEFAEDANVADYIPELAKEDRTKAGVVFIDENGEVCEIGETEKRFSIQSVSKVVTFLMVLENVSKEKIDKTYDMKPTALPFNSIQDLELAGGKPRNPLVNAGAIASTFLLYEKFGEKTFDVILEKFRKMTGNPELGVSEEIYESERDTAWNNRAITNLMAARGIIDGNLPLDDIANMYFRTCSIFVNCRELARISSIISNDGIDIITGERVFEKKYGKTVRTMMAMGGMYDYSGEFAQQVGLPAKSGVGGGIIVASRHKFGLATYCPGLDEFGNSLVGRKMLTKISEEMNWSIY